MSTIMTASEFVKKVKDVAENYKTLYVMGCFGAPMTAANKKRYIEHHSYNQQATRTKMINEATTDTFGFDCVNLIKGILWGWTGDKTKSYGGAKYAINGVPDTNADGMIKLCADVTTDFSKIEIGEALWCKGHIGVYIGDGLAVECTPSWKNKVQITAVKNIGTKSGYNARTWTKHGKLPYIDYSANKKPIASLSSKPSTKVEVAKKVDKTLTGSYKVIAPVSLHIRSGAGTTKSSLGTINKGTIVQNYGYYNIADNGAKWLYVVTPDNIVGYCSSRYLKKC